MIKKLAVELLHYPFQPLSKVTAGLGLGIKSLELE
jgi:hypothetical protein